VLVCQRQLLLPLTEGRGGGGGGKSGWKLDPHAHLPALWGRPATQGLARHARRHGGDAIGGCSRALRRPRLPAHGAHRGLCPAGPLAIL